MLTMNKFHNTVHNGCGKHLQN